MEDYLIKLADILEVEKVLADDRFDEFEVWDSLTILSIISLVNSDLNVSLTSKEVSESKTPKKLYELIEFKRK
jgi:acyl carrier protein